MNIIKDIITDYEKLIKTDFQIPLSNGDIIRFVFQPQDLPHLLGLKYLSDNPVLFEYSEKRLSASELYNRMCGLGEPVIDTNEFENSIYFQEIYDGRIKYFSSDMILDIIRARQIIRFNPKKIKNFTTKLEKIEYMFWKEYRLTDNRYGYFGIGFMSSGTEKDVNYPNTFFFRTDDEYINNQEKVLPYSFMKKDKHGNKTYEIYWDEVWLGLRKNVHYKRLIPKYVTEDGTIAEYLLDKSDDEEAKRHYELLKLDALDCIYLPYMKNSFRWTNDEKRYIWRRIKETGRDYLPNEIMQLLNEYRQRKRDC